MIVLKKDIVERLLAAAGNLSAGGNWPRGELLDAADEIKKLRAENAALRKDRTWFWAIVDEAGLANVPSDEEGALRILVGKVNELETDNAALRLWCCHVRGPDDLYAARDYAHAVKMSDDLNAAIARREKHEDDPVVIAHPMIWPWDAIGHAEDLKHTEADEATRQAKLSALANKDEPK